ncbi:hypothetical protein V6N13_110934 [Hibiscus sabdariffa]
MPLNSKLEDKVPTHGEGNAMNKTNMVKGINNIWQLNSLVSNQILGRLTEDRVKEESQLITIGTPGTSLIVSL